MLTNNGLKIWGAILSKTPSPIAPTVKATDGTDVTATLPFGSSSFTDAFNFLCGNYPTNYAKWVPTFYYLSNLTDIFYGNSSTSDFASQTGAILGDGDTAPDPDDYTLSGNILTDFTASTAISTSIINGKIVGIVNYTITNTGASDLVIKEIGVRRITGSYGYSLGTLVFRDVLATPVTIAPGDTGVVTYKIEIS